MTPLASTAFLLGLFSIVQHCAADFTGVSFDTITEDASLQLTWDSNGPDAKAFPLVVVVSIINQTESGVFGIKTNLSSTE